MSGLPSLQLSPGKVERAADARALAQALRALRAQPGVAALSGPPDAARALLEVLAGRLGPPLRVLVVRGGALPPPDFGRVLPPCSVGRRSKQG